MITNFAPDLIWIDINPFGDYTFSWHFFRTLFFLFSFIKIHSATCPQADPIVHTLTWNFKTKKLVASACIPKCFKLLSNLGDESVFPSFLYLGCGRVQSRLKTPKTSFQVKRCFTSFPYQLERIEIRQFWSVCSVKFEHRLAFDFVLLLSQHRS